MDSNYKRVFAQNLSNLVADLKLNKSTVSTWVNGTKMPRMNKIEQLAHYFGVEKSDLIEDKSDVNDSYYIDPEVAEYANRLKDNPDMRLLFDAAEDMSKDDIDFVVNLIEGSKKREGK